MAGLRKLSRRPTALPAVIVAVLLASTAASGAAPSAQGTGSICGIAGAQRVASSGQLVVVTTPAIDVEACIGSGRAYQLDTMSSVDGPCRLRGVSATLGRYAGIDISCFITVLDERAEEIVTFDVARRTLLRGSRSAVYEHVHPGAVFARNGAFAFIEDFPSHTDLIACDAQARCTGATGLPSHTLDETHHGVLHTLRVTGQKVTWHHGAARRSATLR